MIRLQSFLELALVKGQYALTRFRKKPKDVVDLNHDVVRVWVVGGKHVSGLATETAIFRLNMHGESSSAPRPLTTKRHPRPVNPGPAMNAERFDDSRNELLHRTLRVPSEQETPDVAEESFCRCENEVKRIPKQKIDAPAEEGTLGE